MKLERFFTRYVLFALKVSSALEWRDASTLKPCATPFLFLTQYKYRYLYIFMNICTHFIFMSTSDRLNQLDIEIHEVNHQ
jgi:hypothetical protein